MRRKPIAMIWMVPLVASCGGGGGSGPVVYDPDVLTNGFFQKIAFNGVPAMTIAGTPPANANPSPDLSISVPDQTVNAAAGTKAQVAITVDFEADVDNLFAKIPGAGSFFQAAFAAAGSGQLSLSSDPRLALAAVKAQHAAVAKAASTGTVPKAITTLVFEADIPANLEPGGEVCFEYSVQDVEGLISNVDLACIAVSAPAPAPSPSPSPAPAPTPTPTPTPTPVAECDFTANSGAATWTATGTTQSGQPVNQTYSTTRPGVDGASFGEFLTASTEALLSAFIGGDDALSATTFIDAPAGIRSTGRYTFGESGGICGSNISSGVEDAYFWDQTSSILDVTRYVSCTQTTAYVEVSFSCTGEGLDPVESGSVQGTYSGSFFFGGG